MTDPTTETEGFRAYKAGVAEGRAEGAATERKRIIALAKEKQATYWVGPDDHPAPRRPFALLLQFGELPEGETP